MIQPPFTTQIQDDAAQRSSANLVTTVNQLCSVPIVNGHLLSNINIKFGDNQISHAFGKQLQGWLLVKINADARLFEKTSTDPKKFLVLNSSAQCTISLWVF